MLFRVGCRRGNGDAIVAGRDRLSLLFYGRNHPRYRRIMATNQYMEALMPTELKQLVMSSLTLSRIGNDGHYQGGDACLEEINKEAKSWVSPTGVPTEKEWQVFRNMDSLNKDTRAVVMSATYRFDGKRVLVTGAGKGIGRGLAKKLSECGAEVLALSRTQADLDSLQSEAENIHPVCVDLEDWDATRKAVEDLGPVHLLVNNASIASIQTILEIDKASLDSGFAVNVSSVINVTQVVARGMIERGQGGSIVIISSILSALGLAQCGTYSATKGAQDGVMRVMAKEFGPHQIRVNALHPTVVMTPMGRRYWEENPLREPMLARHPLRTFTDVEDIVDGILFLLSDQANKITGSVLTIDCGITAT